MAEPSPIIACLFTTFPKSTETFLQREVSVLMRGGARLRLYSLWGGGGTFRGLPVARFPKWRLLTLLWMIPVESRRSPGLLRELLRGLATRRAPSWINFWENMLGAGFACLFAGEFRRDPPALVHAAWSGAPATAAWLLWRLTGIRYSAGAHAYDLYEHGGDWWLREKLEAASFVHTSTEMGRRTLIERGLSPDRILCIRRGLESFPELKPLRSNREPLRLLCIARLVEKKGIDRQLAILAALKSAGLPFESRIVGDGPLRGALERLAGRLGIATSVALVGHLPPEQVWDQMAWADVLLHTGVIAASGDRDGLPNVIPEAMACGVMVASSPAAAATEAVRDGESGCVIPVDDPGAWVGALRRLARDDAFAERVRSGGRGWIEANYDATRNVRALQARLIAAAGPEGASRRGGETMAPAHSSS